MSNQNHGNPGSNRPQGQSNQPGVKPQHTQPTSQPNGRPQGQPGGQQQRPTGQPQNPDHKRGRE